MSLSPEPEPELEQAFGSNSSPVQATKKAKKRPTATSPAELPEIVSNGASSSMSAYETLKQAGYIGGSTEFISGEEGFI